MEGKRAENVLRVRAPSTLDEASRSVEVVAVTSDPVEMWDMWRGEAYREILMMEGVRIPSNGQVPLCDSHFRATVQSVLGSFRDIKSDGDKRLVGKVYFSDSPAAREAFQKVKEGHLTDFSVGYTPRKIVDIKGGKKETVLGKEFDGPCQVVSDWSLYELSICPVGADPKAKARSNLMEKSMDKIVEDFLERLRAARADEKPDEDEEKGKQAEPEGDEPKKEDEEEKKKAKKAAKEEPDEPEDEEPKKDDDDEVKGKDGKKSLGEDLARAAVEGERRRAKGIMELCRSLDLGDATCASMLSRGVSVEKARSEALKMVTDKYERGAGGLDFRVTKDEGESFRKRFIDAIGIRTGQLTGKDKPEAGSDELASMPLTELAKACLRQKGLKATGDTLPMVGRAITTSDLPLLLQEGAKRYLLRGFAENQETWGQWTDSGSVTDFRPFKMISVGLDNSLERIYALDEYTYTVAKEEGEEVEVHTFGRGFGLSREAIINDDLGAVTALPQELGRGVSRHVGDAVYNVLASDIMGDKKPLFDSAAHSNVVIGGGDGTPTVDSISKALLKMSEQKDVVGKRLSLRPVFFLAPLALQAACETFFNSQMIGTQALPTTKNIYANHFTRIYDHRLDQLSPTTWYFVGEKAMGVRVLYLRGVKTPYMEDHVEFNVDAIKYKVRFDYGVKAISWRNFIQVKVA
ncbi:MAG: hypothetical protein LBO66_07675 [Deltaproteobacteria bacterium]|jgi:hypothetical protein|nr:hypothetical protein [Deltaproteobacteria bacterium]